MNLPRARQFLPWNILPSNREDLFELVIQMTTSALTQNRQIEELVPILRQLHNHHTRDISAVIADVTQLLKRDLLTLIGLSKAIIRIPMTPPVEDSDEEETPCPRLTCATLRRTGSCLECFSPGHICINCHWYQCPMCHSSRPGQLSRLCPLRVTKDHPEPSTPLMVRIDEPLTDLPIATATPDEDLLIECPPRPSPQIPEENLDPDILIDDRSPIVEWSPPDLTVTMSIEVPTSPSNPVEEVTIEERPLLDKYWDVFPIEVISPTPIRHNPVGPSLCEAFSYIYSDDEEPDPVSQTPLYLDSPPESPPSSSLQSRSNNDSDGNCLPSPLLANDDDEDSAWSF
ncbi:hypothetical protein BU15DRAFT_81314 [Melanogaster broomeanus]|nr:hypothetical protein BU15DRAFT_81314 [Melanogaster broomeanus]